MYNTPSTEGILKAPDQSKEVSASTRVKVMFDKNEFDTVPEYRWTGFSENTNSTSNRGKSRERVFERKEKQEEKKLDVESLCAKLEMITRKISPPKGRVLSYKDYQKETKSSISFYSLVINVKKLRMLKQKSQRITPWVSRMR